LRTRLCNRGLRSLMLLASLCAPTFSRIYVAPMGRVYVNKPTSRPDDTGSLVEAIPRTVLQAVYHAVTGKVENQSKTLKGNVEIHHDDVVRLYSMIKQRLEHYEIVADPSVTVVTKSADDQRLTYSSWERFRGVELGTLEVTSELILKLEFVLQIPNTPSPQRCVVNVAIDSGLPVVSTDQKYPSDFYEYFTTFALEWDAVRVSVDFVDFLVGKTFSSTVEEWFGTLRVAPQSKWAKSSVKLIPAIKLLMAQSGRFGFAIFMAGYMLFAGPGGSIRSIVYAACAGLTIWCALNILGVHFSRVISRRISLAVIPAVVLLTEGDARAYEKVKTRINGARSDVIQLGFVGVTQILLNVVASYAYAALT